MPFGAIAAGRPVQTNFEQVEPTKWILTFTQVEKINHLVIFLFGDSLPIGCGASVYINFTSSSSFSSSSLLTPSTTSSWQFLGYVSNEKPSAIFKLNSLKPIDPSSSSSSFNSMPMSTNPTESMMLDGSSSISTLTATLGISIESQDHIQQLSSLQLNRSSSTPTALTKPIPNISSSSSSFFSSSSDSSTLITNVALKLLQHLYNYVTSFTTTSITPTFTPTSMQPNLTSTSFVPIKTFEDWWQLVQRKIKMDPNSLLKDSNE